MKSFLVVSYDNDQQQWFWDLVGARNRDQAEKLVRKNRPYVQATDAIEATELTDVAVHLNDSSPAEHLEQFLALNKK